MKYALILLALILTGCSSDSPTAPTPVSPVETAPPVVVSPPSPPVGTSPPVMLPPRNPLLDDPRFDLAFYLDFALGRRDRGQPVPLQRFTQAPLVFLYTEDDRGTPIDDRTLDATAAALIAAVGPFSGGTFGIEGLSRGRSLSSPLPHQIIVRWASAPSEFCGNTAVGGRIITLYPQTPRCGCDGFAISPTTVRHEIGHTLGYYHTDAPTDLMYGQPRAGCNLAPSDRELFHARVAYAMPIGSLEP